MLAGQAYLSYLPYAAGNPVAKSSNMKKPIKPVK